MALFTVLHDTAPTFGLGNNENSLFTVVAYGSPDPLGETDMAKTISEKSDLEVCEIAFHATNSIDVPWFEVGPERYGLFGCVQARSTSVGDIVSIEDPNGERFYRCDNLGWTKLDSKPRVKHAPIRG